jgi:hypothetical protein
MINQIGINDFYLKNIESPDCALHRLIQLKYSGISLVHKIQPGETVIDIGCGNNIFKQFIPGLTGIDPVYSTADYQVALQDFVTDKKFNVAFCLGSIMNGNSMDIEQQINRVVKLLTPKARIYWRVRPGDSNLHLEKFPWTLNDHYVFAEKFGFCVAEHQWESVDGDILTPERLYVEWVRE